MGATVHIFRRKEKFALKACFCFSVFIVSLFYYSLAHLENPLN